MNKRTVSALCLLVAAFGGDAHAAGGRVKVASLSTVLTDLARHIGQDRVEVIEIVKAGVDPHEFQPSPGDVQQVAGADVVLVSGKGLEGYLTKLEQSTGTKSKFVDVGGSLSASLKLREEAKTIEDPHWWHSIANVKQAVLVVRNTLIKADPADKEAFAAAAASYADRLDALDNAVKLKVAELPREKRKLVTSHDAFQYFARERGFKIYPIEGISTEAQPSSKETANLIETIKKQGVKAVFFENIENPKVVTSITQETGAKVGGELYADGLGAEGSDAATYETMMHHNVWTIVDALK